MRYKTPAAFRQALEERLGARARELQVPVQRLRKIVSFERFVARVQAGEAPRWLLKGGFALLVRLGEKARTTLDVDLGADLTASGESAIPQEAIRADLLQATRQDLQDHLHYELGPTSELDLKAGPVRAYRFSVRTLLATREFDSFRVDVAVGDPNVAPPAILPSSGLLDFAEVPPMSLRVIAPVQHVAEKIHALNRPREGAENSRVRDLVDLMLLLNLKLPSPTVVRDAVETIFHARGTHSVPLVLNDPPKSWHPEYRRMSEELELTQKTADEAMARLRAFWKGLGWQEK